MPQQQHQQEPAPHHHQRATAKAALVIFARLPVPGRAKTRLAAGVGAEGAAELYRLCAERAFREALR
jgi:glycosyltransferase A (GT-A) superfamily protein (DUF2064 family)